MATFSDDFNRANGALGGNWSSVYGNLDILGGWCRQNGTGYGVATNSTLSDSGRHECTVRASFYSGASNTCGPYVKFIPGNLGCYSAQIRYSAPTWYLSIYAGTIGTMSAIASVALASAPAGINTITLVWDNGELTASISTGASVSVSNNSYVNGTLMGIAAQTTVAQVDWVTMVTGAAPDFQVSPDVVGNYGATTALTFTGTNTEWTSGTPGSPTFTCDHGTLSGQVVASATSASATFDPGDYLGPVVITDPSTGLTDTIIVTSDPNVLPPGSVCPFDEDFITLANASEQRTIDDQLMTENSVVIGFDYPFNNLTVPEALGEIWVALFHTGLVPEGETTPLSLLATLWQILNGANDPAAGPYTPATSQPIKLDTEQILQRIKDIQTGADWTFYDLALLLGGSPVLSHQDLKRAIDEIDLSSITDLLYSMWGPQRPTLTDLAQLVNEMATVAGYTLGDVLDAIAALQLGVNVDLTPVMNRLDLIQPDTQISLSHLHADLATTDGVVDTMAASLSQIRGPGLTTFQDILDAITQLRHDISLDLSTLKLPPIWPGFAHVTLGSSVDLATVTNVDGPMHGCIVQITATEPGTSFMQYDGVKAWRHVGGLVFYDDHGQCETYQALGFGEALYVPKTMAVAQGVKLFKSHLPRGSITPWTINP